jgi:hypothetical protein
MTYEFDRDAHIHRLGGRVIPGSSDILKDAGFSYPAGNMELGRAVHLATEYDDLGELDERTVTDEVLPFLLAWRSFRQENQFKPRRIEESNVNVALGFAATLDREGTWINPKTHTPRAVLVEIKKYAPTFFTGLQLALQDLTLPTLTAPRDRVVAQLKPDGTYQIHWFKDPCERNLAMSLVSLYWYKRNGGK